MILNNRVLNSLTKEMELNKEQLKMIAQAIDINEVKKLIYDNLSEYNKFIIEEEDLEDK